MRLLVINSVGEPASADLRRRHPGKVLQRPLIGGSPLVGRRVLTKDMLSAAVVNQLEYLVLIGNVRVVEVGARTRQVDFADLRLRLGHNPVILSTTPPDKVRGIETDMVLSEDVSFLSAAPAQKLRGASATLVVLDEEVSFKAPSVPAEVAERASEDDTERLIRERFEEILDLQARAEVEAGTPASADAVLAALGDVPILTPAALMPEVATAECWVVPEDLDALVRSSKNAALSSALVVMGGTGTGKNKLKLVSEVSASFADPSLDPANKFKALGLLRAE